MVRGEAPKGIPQPFLTRKSVLRTQKGDTENKNEGVIGGEKRTMRPGRLLVEDTGLCRRRRQKRGTWGSEKIGEGVESLPTKRCRSIRGRGPTIGREKMEQDV